MAFTRKMLKAMGIDEDKIEQIIEAHAETVDALKDERDNYKADAEKLAEVQKELTKAKETLAKHGEGEVVAKSESDKVKKEFDDYKNAQTEKETRQAKERAVRELFKAVGISEKRLDAVMKVTNLDGYEIDKDGKIKDAEKHTESAKTEWAEFIETTTTKGARTATPPATSGGTKMTKAEIYAKDEHGRYKLSTAERQKALSANPDLLT
jgi:hypothetical protein